MPPPPPPSNDSRATTSNPHPPFPPGSLARHTTDGSHRGGAANQAHRGGSQLPARTRRPRGPFNQVIGSFGGDPALSEEEGVAAAVVPLQSIEFSLGEMEAG